jgi:hypothetical protein
MSKNAALTPATFARLAARGRAERAAVDERARLAQTPDARAKLTPVYTQGAFGDWEWLLADPEHCVLARWLNRRLIEPQHYAAGLRLRAAHWRGGLDGVRAVDPMREPVDGGRHKEPTVTQLAARDEFNAAVRALNRVSAALVVDVAVLDRDATEIERARGWRKGYGMLRAKEALEDLAAFYGW